MKNISSMKFDAMREQMWGYASKKQYIKASEIATTILEESYALDAIHVMALALIADNHVPEGLNWLGASLSLSPAPVHYFRNAATILFDHEHYPTAMHLINEGLIQHPNDVELTWHKGLGFAHLAEWQQAINTFQATLKLNPQFHHAKLSMGYAYHMLEQFDPAIKLYQELLQEDKIDPVLRENAMNNLVGVHIAQAQNQRALDLINHEYPDSTDHSTLFNKSLVLLALGAWLEGWQLYRHRMYTPNNKVPPVALPEPDTLSDMQHQSVMLYHEQGLGDSLMTLRYAKLIRPHCKKLTIVLPETMLRIAKTMNVDAEYTTVYEVEKHDMAIPMLNCPNLFKTTINTIPYHDEPYLHVACVQGDDKKNVTLNARLPRIGLVWAGNSRPNDSRAFNADKRRSMAFNLFEPILRLHDKCEFISLQMPNHHVKDDRLQQPLNNDCDLLDTAEIINTLDLVITIDSAIAHLTGALGKPVWMLSRYDQCWRWAGTWYDRLTIYQQSKPYSWSAVIDRVTKEVNKFISEA